jgi:hypothetical protein
MAQLNEIVKDTLKEYVGSGFDNRTFPLVNEEEQIYAVNVIDTPVRKRRAGVVVIARVDGDRVIIEEDLTDRPLVDALVRAGVPRDKIVLAYAGETVTTG